MFSSGQSKTARAAVDTLVGRQTEVLGDIRFSGGLHVDGRVRGAVTSVGDKPAFLSVGENGCIEGNVKVPNVTLSGTVTGDVHAGEHLTLTAKAKISGNVHYRLLEMAAGATINGKLLHAVEVDVPAALTHETDASTPVATSTNAADYGATIS